MTLSLGLTIFRYLKHKRVFQRDVLIIDECSEIESEIMRFFTFQVSCKTVMRAISPGWVMSRFYEKDDHFWTRWKGIDGEMTLGTALKHMRPKNAEQIHNWMIDIGYIAKKELMWIDHLGGSDENYEKKHGLCEGIVRMAMNALQCSQSSIPTFNEVTDDIDGRYSVKIAPLDSKGMLEELAAPFAKRIVYVSATTGSAEMFKASHGYTRPIARITAPSTFPVDNRLVYSVPAGNMSAKTQETDFPKLVKSMLEIVNMSSAKDEKMNHVAQKGIIHTYNNKLTDRVVQVLSSNGMFSHVFDLRGSGHKREEVMKKFRNVKGRAILVSPSAMLGLSLNDDLARWQIIVKMPYPFLGDPSISYRKEHIQGWYEWQTAKDLMQTFGRIVRSKDDWGSTYILDESFQWFYRKNSHLFPDFIKKSIVHVNL
jgi:Rad3-related DNA helicase